MCFSCRISWKRLEGCTVSELAFRHAMSKYDLMQYQNLMPCSDPNVEENLRITSEELPGMFFVLETLVKTPVGNVLNEVFDVLEGTIARAEIAPKHVSPERLRMIAKNNVIAERKEREKEERAALRRLQALQQDEKKLTPHQLELMRQAYSAPQTRP